MARLLRVRKLWQNGEFCNAEGVINADEIKGAPRLAWLKRSDGGETYTLTTVNPNDANALQGVLVDLESQGQILVDTATVANLTTAANACCDAVGGDVVAAQYNGVIPAYNSAAAAVYTITRNDNGSAYAVQKANLDYSGKVVTFQHYSNVAGVSKYRVTAFSAPIPVGADVVAAGEPA